MSRQKGGVKVFYNHTDWIYKTKSGITMCVAEYLMFMTSRNSAEIVFNSNTRTEIANRLKSSRVSISRAMKELLGYGVIAKAKDNDGNEIYNHYILNPLMYWYGDLPKRISAMKKYGELFGYMVE